MDSTAANEFVSTGGCEDGSGHGVAGLTRGYWGVALRARSAEVFRLVRGARLREDTHDDGWASTVATRDVLVSDGGSERDGRRPPAGARAPAAARRARCHGGDADGYPGALAEGLGIGARI